MAYFLGQLVGGAIICTLLGLLIGLMFKRKGPDERALAASLIAWFVGGLLMGNGKADGGGFTFIGFGLLIPGAIAAFFFLRSRHRKKLDQEAAAIE